jgi:predicted ABC-type ATPase
MGRRPRVCVLAGPNGAGKTTSAAPLVRDRWGIETFVNADVIAQGLAGFATEAVNVTAGRLMLDRLDALARAREDFAFETTLASRSLLPRLVQMRADGYEVRVVFVSLPAVELSLQRVRQRVLAGGHDVPEATVRRRFARGLANFHRIYRSVADRSWLLDGSGVPPRLVADSESGSAIAAPDPDVDEGDPLTRDVVEATAAGVERARRIHKALGLPIVIWRDGRPVWVDAEPLAEVPPPPAEPPRAVSRH